MKNNNQNYNQQGNEQNYNLQYENQSNDNTEKQNQDEHIPAISKISRITIIKVNQNLMQMIRRHLRITVSIE